MILTLFLRYLYDISRFNFQIYSMSGLLSNRGTKDIRKIILSSSNTCFLLASVVFNESSVLFNITVLYNRAYNFIMYDGYTPLSVSSTNCVVLLTKFVIQDLTLNILYH